MSEDLFAAFNEITRAQPTQQNWTQEPSLHNLGLQDTPQSNDLLGVGEATQAGREDADEDFDDDFGDFEDASGAATWMTASQQPNGHSGVVEKSTLPRSDGFAGATSEAPKKTSAQSPSRESSNPPFETKRNDETGRAKVPPQATPKAPVQHAPKKSNLPFELKTKDETSRVGRHPFADHMDFLFNADGDEDDYNAGADDLNDLSNNPEAAVAFSKQLFAAQLAEREKEKPRPTSVNRQEAAKQTPRQTQAASPLKQSDARRPPDSMVLFDAEEDAPESENSFGDFGDFEEGGQADGNGDVPAGPAEVSMPPTLSNIDLLGLDDHQSSDQSTEETTTYSREKPKANAQRQTKAAQRPQAEGETSAVLQDDDDDNGWDDFETAVAFSIPSHATHSALPNASTTSTTTTIRPTTSLPQSETLPPTNIPPPATLLSLYSTIFATAQTSLFKPLSALDAKQRPVLLAHPATQAFLHNHLRAAIVLGHIIAGRKLRWKRDQYLAQGMRIGPVGGKSGGMKLTGVDKGELAKEDREVLDAVRGWKAQVGKLKGAVTTSTSAAAVGARKGRLPAVPEIAEQMPVKSLKATEGGFTAPHACALCGLRRDERVMKVDVDVEDSFGEWWAQGVSMHSACKGFWDEHRGLLKSR